MDRTFAVGIGEPQDKEWLRREPFSPDSSSGGASMSMHTTHTSRSSWRPHFSDNSRRY
jgi:hypothetical protein